MIPAGGVTSVTVQLNVSVASFGRPGVSRTVTLTAYGPGAALKAIVPLIRPLEVLIVRPGGRFVAPYTRVSPSGSVAAADRLITAPSASVRLGRSWLNVGGPLTAVVKDDVGPIVVSGPSETVAYHSYAVPCARPGQDTDAVLPEGVVVAPIRVNAPEPPI